MTLALRVLVVLVVATLYTPTLLAMAHVWWTDTYAGHGMFVPLFCVLVAWMERDRLRAAVGRGSAAGLVFLAVGFAVLGVGHAAGSLLLQGLSVPLAVAGLVAWSFGLRFLRHAAFPVWFLALMVPLPRPVVDAFTLDLQLFAASVAASALRLLDIPIHRVGTLIELPSLTLRVAEVCNGLRFLMALLVLTTAFAQVTQRTIPRKITLALSSIPIAILANAARVAAIGVGVHLIGPEAASGTIHHWIGKGVWGLTLIPLAALGFLLSRIRVSRATRLEEEAA